jgi:hypothetical protein
MVASLFAAFALAACVTSWTTRVGPRDYADPIVAAVGAVVAVFVLWRWCFKVEGSKWWLLVVAAVLILGVALIPRSWILDWRLHWAEPQLTAIAQRQLNDAPGCHAPVGGASSIAPIGRVEQICRELSDYSRQVEIYGRSDPARELIYVADSSFPGGRPGVGDKCINHIDGPWWEVTDRQDARGCPSGFEFIGGG